jgi:hypothetical protein
MEIPGLDGKQASQLLFCTNMILSDFWCAETKIGVQRHPGHTEQYAQKPKIQKQFALRREN